MLTKKNSCELAPATPTGSTVGHPGAARRRRTVCQFNSSRLRSIYISRSIYTAVLLICWMLWKEKNNKTFDRRVRTIDQMLEWVVDEIVSWFQAGFQRLEPLVVALGRSPGRALILI